MQALQKIYLTSEKSTPGVAIGLIKARERERARDRDRENLKKDKWFDEIFVYNIGYKTVMSIPRPNIFGISSWGIPFPLSWIKK